MGVKSKNLITAVAVVFFVILILPLVAMGLYSHPYSDDFWYGAVVRTALEGGTLWDALAAATNQVGVIFETWQGSYAAVFMMALHPGVWSFEASAYWLGSVLMLAAIIGGVYALSWTALSRLGTGPTPICPHIPQQTSWV